MKINVNQWDTFEHRHNSAPEADVQKMLKAIGVNSIDQLVDETIPANIRLSKDLKLPEAQTEVEYLEEFKTLMSKNQIFNSFIGQGYYNNHLPQVIKRNILENPGWYTAYTPYQAEIAQGRLEALLNFQTMVSDLCGMELANASLLDEGTAAAEAMGMFLSTRKKDKKKAFTFLVDQHCHPQTIDIVQTRATPMGIKVEVCDIFAADLSREDVYAFLYQYPNTQGEAINVESLIATAIENQVKVVAAADLLSLCLLKSPGEMGADAVIGTSQRFGIPMGFGGPHAAFFATKEAYKRQIPGRIIGVSVDAQGNKAYRMALQTREQHIKREKATSNICTAQVLLAVISSMYACYHGPQGLKQIAARTHGLTKLLYKALNSLGVTVNNSNFFDTINVTADAEAVMQVAVSKNCNFRKLDAQTIAISLDETTRLDEVKLIVSIFEEALSKQALFNFENEAAQLEVEYPADLMRTSEYMTHPVFNSHHSEHEILRYMKTLENKDLSMVHSMISLGSCTMKLNATSEMVPVTWPEVGNIHPFAPRNQWDGYAGMLDNLSEYLCEITGFAAMSLQPNSGAQGEYAGLMAIRGFHYANGDTHRNIVIIPSSAHGTNPASAVMAGMKVVVTKCDDNGNIDIADLKEKAELHKDNLSALMVTYPSTHGVFEEGIIEICDIIHQNGGKVYMDGANMNAQVGLTSPARIGADVCHLNLHKTFCIPHGGGGPGMGPIGVTKDLAPYLPGHVEVDGSTMGAVSAAPYSSASILPISYGYIRMMGGNGLTNATKRAILNANYIKAKLEGHYDILYVGANGRCAHEMIVDCRPFKKVNIEVADIAKRLMDYGFHAPTVSFPVPGTMMIEPTESEALIELDRFCDALISIRAEIKALEDGTADLEDNVLINAPHTHKMVIANEWDHKYSREEAAYPLPFVAENKFWASVARIDNAYGDRNLVCSCLPIEEYIEA